MSVSCVILAAGQSSRFGNIKALAKFEDQTLLEHALSAAKNCDCNDIHLVLGAHKTEIETNIALENCNIIYNPDHATGMASSIKLAVNTLKDSDALLFMAIDQPLIQAEDLNALISMHQKFSNRMVAAKYASSVGIPALFPRNYYNALLRLEGDKGAKKLLTTTTIQKVEMPEAQLDLDHPEDLDALLETRKD